MFGLLDPLPHNRARYELVGQNYTFQDVAKEFSYRLGKEVVCKRVTREEAAARGALHLRAQRDYALEALDRMLYYYDRR